MPARFPRAQADPLTRSRRPQLLGYNMSVIDPPALDISEEAQDLILDFIRGESTPSVARSTFKSFCLVSRKWLSSGRRALYYEPLAVRLRDWDQATQLQRAMEGNKGLGRSVRSLETLDADARDLNGMQLRGEAGVRQSTPRAAYKWSRKLVKLSPSARKVALSLCCRQHATKLAVTLPPLITLLKLRSLSRNFQYDQIEAFFTEAAPSLAHLAELSLFEFKWPYGQHEDLGPQLDFAISTLSVSNCFMTIPQVLAFVPRDPSSLRHLSLTSDISITQAHAILLISAVGPHLHSLSFTSLWFDNTPLLPSEYDERDGHPLPIHFFSPLPELRQIKLQGMTAMSLEKLDTLLTHSPKLEQLDLSHSAWSFGKPPFAQTAKEAFLADKIQIEAMVDGAREALRSVNLGLMPVAEGTEWAALKGITERGGPQIAFEGCHDPAGWSRCECGELHRSM